MAERRRDPDGLGKQAIAILPGMILVLLGLSWADGLLQKCRVPGSGEAPKPQLGVNRTTVIAPPSKAAPDRATSKLGNRARVVILDVQVQPTKANGKRWDGGWFPYSLPDLKIHVRNCSTGQAYWTPVAKDTLSARFDCPSVDVQGGDHLLVEVWDADVKYDDLVGKHMLTFPAEMLEDEQRLDLAFGQVRSLHLLLQPRDR